MMSLMVVILSFISLEEQLVLAVDRSGTLGELRVADQLVVDAAWLRRRRSGVLPLSQRHDNLIEGEGLVANHGV